MRLEDIITTLNNSEIMKDLPLGKFVLQRNISDASETFKAYKKYELRLWFVFLKENKKFPILSSSEIQRMITGKENEVLEIQESKFLSWLLKIIYTKEIKTLIVGEKKDGELDICERILDTCG